MFLKHLATPIDPFRDPLGGRDPQFEEPWSNRMFLICLIFSFCLDFVDIISARCSKVDIGRNAISFLYNGNIDHLIHVHLTVLNFFSLSFWFKFVMHVVGSVVIEYF